METAKLLHMMFLEPYRDYALLPEVVQALDLIFILHADHEQNCSTATVRIVASGKANLFVFRGSDHANLLKSMPIDTKS